MRRCGLGGHPLDLAIDGMPKRLHVAQMETGGLEILLVQALKEFVPEDHHFNRGFKPQSDLLAPDLQDHYADIVPDDYPFAYPTCKYQQVLLPSLDFFLITTDSIGLARVGEKNPSNFSPESIVAMFTFLKVSE